MNIRKCFEEAVNKDTYKMFKDAYIEGNIVSIDLVYILSKEFDYINTFYFFDDYCTIDTSNDLSILRSELKRKQVMQIIIDNCPDFTGYLTLDKVITIDDTIKLAIKVISRSRKKEKFIDELKLCIKHYSEYDFSSFSEKKKLLTDILNLVENE